MHQILLLSRLKNTVREEVDCTKYDIECHQCYMLTQHNLLLLVDFFEDYIGVVLQLPSSTSRLIYVGFAFLAESGQNGLSRQCPFTS